MPNNPDDFNLDGINNPNGKDDIIDSSFAVQFKPGDKTESIADKLKETKENIEKTDNSAANVQNKQSGGFNFSSDNDFMDEFDKFEFDFGSGNCFCSSLFHLFSNRSVCKC